MVRLFLQTQLAIQLCAPTTAGFDGGPLQCRATKEVAGGTSEGVETEGTPDEPGTQGTCGGGEGVNTGQDLQLWAVMSYHSHRCLVSLLAQSCICCLATIARAGESEEYRLVHFHREMHMRELHVPSG